MSSTFTRNGKQVAVVVGDVRQPLGAMNRSIPATGKREDARAKVAHAQANMMTKGTEIMACFDAENIEEAMVNPRLDFDGLLDAFAQLPVTPCPVAAARRAVQYKFDFVMNTAKRAKKRHGKKPAVLSLMETIRETGEEEMEGVEVYSKARNGVYSG